MLNRIHILSFVSIVSVSLFQYANGIDWREEVDLFWAERCDFSGDDITSKLIPGKECGPECARTPECTHFAWSEINGGECWLKRNPVTKDQAQSFSQNSICGLMKSPPPEPTYSTGADCTRLRVEPISKLPSGYSVDTKFYKKFVNANGIPIMGPNDVSDYALVESARILEGVTNNLKDGFLPALIASHKRGALWSKTATACSIPEADKPCTLENFQGGLTMPDNMIYQDKPDNMICDKYSNTAMGRFLVHEFGHVLNQIFDKVDPDLQKSLDKAYANAKANNLWPPGAYLMTNTGDYFAVGQQCWFHATDRTCDMGVCGKDEFEKKDKMLYDLVARIYKEPNWSYHNCNEMCKK